MNWIMTWFLMDLIAAITGKIGLLSANSISFPWMVVKGHKTALSLIYFINQNHTCFIKVSWSCIWYLQSDVNSSAFKTFNTFRNCSWMLLAFSSENTPYTYPWNFASRSKAYLMSNKSKNYKQLMKSVRLYRDTGVGCKLEDLALKVRYSMSTDQLHHY